MAHNAADQDNNLGLMLMAGGTGGHVFPALAVAERLRARGVPLTWLGTGRGLEATLVRRAGYPFMAVSTRGLRRTGVLQQLAAPLWLMLALIQCLWHLRRRKPGAVLG
ncbi:MAG: UDP-N-acetylglucosamine--N-acetylmuramyl-(pentapeptide) pyrophosphoryl-undecaprenol N-acetylglucosamine transferase, partial [Gammaproteobacteria bacterium]